MSGLLLLPLLVGFYVIFSVGLDGWVVAAIWVFGSLWLFPKGAQGSRELRFPHLEKLLPQLFAIGMMANVITLDHTRSYQHSPPSCFDVCLDLQASGTHILHGYPWSWLPDGVMDFTDFLALPARFLGNVLVWGILTLAVLEVFRVLWERLSGPNASGVPVTAIWGRAPAPLRSRDWILAGGLFLGVIALILPAATTLLWWLSLAIDGLGPT